MSSRTSGALEITTGPSACIAPEGWDKRVARAIQGGNLRGPRRDPQPITLYRSEAVYLRELMQNAPRRDQGPANSSDNGLFREASRIVPSPRLPSSLIVARQTASGLTSDDMRAFAVDHREHVEARRTGRRRPARQFPRPVSASVCLSCFPGSPDSIEGGPRPLCQGRPTHPPSAGSGRATGPSPSATH